jgi:hypothetical protein
MDVTQKFLSKVSDFNAANAILISGMFQYGQKDQILSIEMALLTRISIPDLVNFAGANYSTSSTRDSLINADRFIVQMTSAELISLIQATSNAKLEVAQKYINKVSDFTAANAVLIAHELQYGQKDTWLALAMAKLGHFTTQEIIAISEAAYGAGSSILQNCRASITDMNNANALVIAAKFNYGTKDAWLTHYLETVRTISTADLTLFVNAAYSTGTQMLINQMSKVSDLTVANLLTLVSLIGNSNKDTILLAGVDQVTDLNATNLILVANQAYYGGNKDQILQRGLARIASSGSQAH